MGYLCGSKNIYLGKKNEKTAKVLKKQCAILIRSIDSGVSQLWV